ncbi:MAG TPA: EAL domain-containing protein [Lysobacter sp.]|nr:EAL domain-containing protein [Lysobacter sp.]
MRLDLDSPGLLSALLDSMADHAVILVDPDGRVRLWSIGAERLLGYRGDDMTGRPLSTLLTAEDRADGAFDAAVDAALRDGRALDIRRLVRADGSTLWADCSFSPIRDGDGRLAGVISVCRDATARKRDEETMLHLARIDPLTGLAARSAFDEKLADCAEAALRAHRSMALHVIDIDRLKRINERHGRAAGDALLREAARRIAQLVRPTDVLARLGDDEFALLQPDVDDATDGGRMAAWIVDALAQPFDVDGTALCVGASIGVSVFPRDTVDARQLLRMADVALYKAKADRRGGYRYFTADLDRIAHRLGRARTHLREAIERRALSLHYQPQIDTRSGRAVGMEALLRCSHPALADYPIPDLIALAASTGLIGRLGVWCLDEACRQARAWRDLGIPPLRMCVNFRASELDDASLLDRVADILARTGLTSGDIEIEITEQQLVEYGRPGASVLDDLRAMGASLAIDDFGTGYSSLGYLAQLPVDRIKLDRSFVERVPEDRLSCTVALAVVNLAHTLELGIVAEGVETEAQARFLDSTRCEAQQGFYFSRPMDADAMTRWLLEHGATSGAGDPLARRHRGH